MTVGRRNNCEMIEGGNNKGKDRNKELPQKA